VPVPPGQFAQAGRRRRPAITVPGGKIADAPASRKRVEVLRRDHAADHDHDVRHCPVSASSARSAGTSVRVPGGQRVHADHVHVRLDRLPGHLARSLEQRADVHVETENRRTRSRSPSGRDRVRPGPSWRPGCAAAGPLRRRRRPPVPVPLRRCATSRPRAGTRPRWYGSGRRAGPTPAPMPRRSRRRSPWPGPASMASASRFRDESEAAAVSAASALSTEVWSRSARSRRSLATWASRTPALSTLRTSIRSSSATRGYLFTPITGCRPESIRAWVRAAASSMRSLGMPASIALAIPPAASTSAMWPHARRARS